MPKPPSKKKKSVKKSGTPQSAVSGKKSGVGKQANRDRRVRRDFLGGSPLCTIEQFLSDYIVLSPLEILVAADWVLASWLIDRFDRFPHLAITSPEKRCGKTRLLEVLELVCHNAYNTPTNMSPAALYRLIQSVQPTILLDEAQSIKRRGSETAEVFRELLNAGINKNAKVFRCGGENRDDVQEFSIYGPKVLALIGGLDGVLADRCLPVAMKRKTHADQVQRFRTRVAEPIGQKISKEIEKWADEHGDKIAELYDTLDTFDMENDRMAELLLPLQAVLKVADESRIPELQEYANSLDEKDEAIESDGVRLLAACREIFSGVKSKDGQKFLSTESLIQNLLFRTEEPWSRWRHGARITPEALANILRPYGIRSGRPKDQSARGFFAYDFEESWGRYLPPIPQKNPTNPPNKAGSKPKKRKSK